MKRRRFIMLGAVSAGSVSGCLDRLAPEDSTSTATTSPQGTETPGKRLSVLSVVDGPLNVTMKLVDLSTDDEVYNRTLTFERREKVSLDDHFAQEANYQFVLSIDNNVVFEREIYDYEGYDLVIRSRDSVDIESHWEV